MSRTNSNSSHSKKKKLARFGIGSKGVVFILMGGLTAWSAFGSGGKKTDSKGAMEYLIGQPFGKVLLWTLAAGLACYVFWRMYQAFIDPENKGNDRQGLAERVGFFWNGLIYLIILYGAVSLLIGSGGSDGGSESIIQKLLSKAYGRWLVAGVALAYLGNAIYLMFLAYSGKFKKEIGETEMDDKAQKLMLNVGRVGYTALGLVMGMIAYLTVKAAISYNASEARGIKDAFTFIQNEFGAFVLVIMALGLATYGVFMLIKASERNMKF